MFFLFRIISLNTSGVFLFLSYSPILIIFYIWVLIALLGLSFWSFYFDFFTIILFIFITFFSIFTLLLDILLDASRGIFDNTTLNRASQYCFLWFVLSEIGLFASFFWSAFGLGLLMALEFSFSFFCIPLMYSLILVDFGFIFYWFFLDIFSIILNTFYLFCSGLLCNFFLILLLCRFNLLASLFLFLGFLLGFLFIWNQLWEFTLLNITISANVYCTTLYVIDMLHFSHVSIGVMSLFLILLKLVNKYLCDNRLLFVVLTIFYWHFVDLIWFILLRFVYFDILCVLFLI